MGTPQSVGLPLAQPVPILLIFRVSPHLLAQGRDPMELAVEPPQGAIVIVGIFLMGHLPLSGLGPIDGEIEK